MWRYRMPDGPLANVLHGLGATAESLRDPRVRPARPIGIRDDFLNFTGKFGFIVVHGHNPVTNVDFLANRINIDTGAYMTNRLTVLRIDAEGVTALETAPK